jgi:DNA-binding phage protein
MESLTSKRADLLKKLHAHRKFNTYMNAVLEASDDFHETRDVIARHRTLVATQQVRTKTDLKRVYFMSFVEL